MNSPADSLSCLGLLSGDTGPLVLGALLLGITTLAVLARLCFALANSGDRSRGPREAARVPVRSSPNHPQHPESVD